MSLPQCGAPHRFGFGLLSNIRSAHRYLKNIDCLSVVVCPLLVPNLPRHFPFFAAAIKSTNEANILGGICH